MMILVYLGQVGVVHFAPYRSLFMSSVSHSRTSFPGGVSLPSLLGYPARNWRAAQHKEQLPVLGISLQSLMEKLKVRHLCCCCLLL